MEGFWAVFWLALVLKIPIFMLLYIVWWAVKDPPLAAVDGRDDGGSDRDPRPHPRGPMPTPPRRGQHAGSPPVVAGARAHAARPPARAGRPRVAAQRERG